ncbi:MAG: hypothetical protein SF187_21400 [Deltaproteobacteria bacterium]|nr:hypothetical protein [Deltaproteobacteria bacterium]
MKNLRMPCLLLCTLYAACGGNDDEDLSDAAVCAGMLEVFRGCLTPLQVPQAAQAQTACTKWLVEIKDEATSAQQKQRLGFPEIEKRAKRYVKNGFGCYLEGQSAAQLGFDEFLSAYGQIAVQLAAFEIMDGTYVDVAQVKRSCFTKEATPTSCESDFLKGSARLCDQKVEMCQQESDDFSSGDDGCWIGPALLGKSAWPTFETCVASTSCAAFDACLEKI